DYKEDPSLGWPQIIEGIGSTSGLLGNIEPDFEGWNELLCFSIDNDVVWRSWRDTCYVITDSCASVGIDKALHPKAKVVCYPNPVSSSTSVYFEIDQSNNFNNYLMIFDLYGKEISSHEFHKNFFTIKSPESNGVYIVKIFTKNNYYTCKLIVTN
ncbi:MAG: T9SS type A sorting domain-containing protein, partial [Bacteroidales bacterium]|nr:T9SS type A sorting domain-containing protein [Bacteroidales bacterium]